MLQTSTQYEERRHEIKFADACTVLQSYLSCIAFDEIQRSFLQVHSYFLNQKPMGIRLTTKFYLNTSWAAGV